MIKEFLWNPFQLSYKPKDIFYFLLNFSCLFKIEVGKMTSMKYYFSTYEIQDSKLTIKSTYSKGNFKKVIGFVCALNGKYRIKS